MDNLDDDIFPQPVCPYCGQEGIRLFTSRLICDDCQHVEAAARRKDEGEDLFKARLEQMATRWRTTTERMAGRQDYDPFHDRDWIG